MKTEELENCTFTVTDSARRVRGDISKILGDIEDLFGIAQHDILNLASNRLSSEAKANALLIDLFDGFSTEGDDHQFAFEDLRGEFDNHDIKALVRYGYLIAKYPDQDLMDMVDKAFGGPDNLFKTDEIKTLIKERTEAENEHLFKILIDISSHSKTQYIYYRSSRLNILKFLGII